MNAPLPIARATSSHWDCVRGHWYIATPDDFPEGCGIVMSADTGHQWGIGKNKLGITVRLRLYTPLCDGCDEPIDNGCCHNCEVVHADLPA